jgi:hypothetical protein
MPTLAAGTSQAGGRVPREAVRRLIMTCRVDHDVVPAQFQPKRGNCPEHTPTSTHKFDSQRTSFAGAAQWARHRQRARQMRVARARARAQVMSHITTVPAHNTQPLCLTHRFANNLELEHLSTALRSFTSRFRRWRRGCGTVLSYKSTPLHCTFLISFSAEIERISSLAVISHSDHTDRVTLGARKWAHARRHLRCHRACQRRHYATSASSNVWRSAQFNKQVGWHSPLSRFATRRC